MLRDAAVKRTARWMTGLHGIDGVKWEVGPTRTIDRTVKLYHLFSCFMVNASIVVRLEHRKQREMELRMVFGVYRIFHKAVHIFTI